MLLLHGTGGDEFDLLGIGAHLAPGSNLISPRGRAPEGLVNRWFARFAPGVLDEEDIVLRAAELAEFVPTAARRHGLDDSAVWAVGFSNGANIAAALMLLHPEILAGAVLLRPMLPLRPEQTPDLSGLPVYVAAGTRDTMIPRSSTEELAVLLEESGADVNANWVEADHGLLREEIDQARLWLSARLEQTAPTE
jgi:predicted esterase